MKGAGFLLDVSKHDEEGSDGAIPLSRPYQAHQLFPAGYPAVCTGGSLVGIDRARSLFMTVFYGILLPFLGTVLGAGCVFFLKNHLVCRCSER